MKLLNKLFPLKTIKKFASLAACSAMICASLSSCNSGPLFDFEGDCDPHYYLQFVFDRNMHYNDYHGIGADAFAAQVGSVEVYVFNPSTGEFVASYKDSGNHLRDYGYRLELDNLTPGDYDIIAWCGLENNEDHFTLQKNVSRPEHLTCTMTRSVDAEDNTVYCDKNLKPLFHGRLSHKFPDKQGDHYATVYLTKNTNYIQLALHHNAGELESDRFSVTMEDTNGYLAHDNSLLSDDLIQYRPWSQRGGVVDMDMLNYSTKAAEDGTGFLVAELATSRLMADNDPRLTVTDKQTGQAVFSLPLVKYLLMMKSDRYAAMDGQEYLDREDEYSVIVFLENSKNNEGWLAAQIVINGWHIVNNGNVGL